MIAKKKGLFGFILFTIDLFIVFVSYIWPAHLKKFIGKPYSLQNFSAINDILPYLVVAFVILFFVYRLYEVEETDFYEIFLGIVFTSVIILFLAFALSFFVRAFAVPRTLVLSAFIFQMIFLFLVHYIVYKIYLSILPPISMLIVSSNGSRASEVKEYISGLRNQIVFGNFLFDNNHLDEDIVKLNELIDKYEVFIIDNALPASYKDQLLKLLVYKNKPVYIIPDIYELLLLNSTIHLIEDKMFLKINFGGMSRIDSIMKRTLDIIVSSFALVVFSPVILIVSIAIFLDSGRPIYYLQERVGLNGKRFRVIKFRTMIQNAEKNTGAVLSNANDPRITRVGKFLRRSGLDEIPQFFNVLRGDMSVVGPRPERPEIIQKIKEKVPDYDMRLKVKPGITGFAQLAGKYDTPFEEKLKLDLTYSKQRFLILTDIYVILNTVKLFFLPRKRK